MSSASDAAPIPAVRTAIRSRLLTPIVVPGVIAVAAACTGGAPGTPVPRPDDTASIIMTEFAFTPSDPVSDAGVVAIVARNEGVTEHDLRVERDGIAIGALPPVGPDREATLTVRLEPATYRLVCTIPGHEAQGMSGTLTVQGS